jgi:hypothetical protein
MPRGSFPFARCASLLRPRPRHPRFRRRFRFAAEMSSATRDALREIGAQTPPDIPRATLRRAKSAARAAARDSARGAESVFHRAFSFFSFAPPRTLLPARARSEPSAEALKSPPSELGVPYRETGTTAILAATAAGQSPARTLPLGITHACEQHESKSRPTLTR